MRKLIVRYLRARLDVLPDMTPGVIIQYTEHNRRGYIPDVIQINFDAKGNVIRVETHETIYVQVPNG